MKTFADLLVGDRLTLGTWNQIAAPELTDILGWNGFDYAIVDCEHAPFSIEAAERQARACLAAGLVPLVRVPAGDTGFVSRALDAGFTHVVVPNLGTAAEAEAAVASTRYAPEGTRGACPCVRATGHFTTDWPAHVARNNAETVIIALIETVEGVENAAAIAATDGVVAVMPGPFDLSVSMGLEGNWRADQVEAALLTIADATRAAQKPFIMPVFANAPDELTALVQLWRERGAKSLILGSDKIIFADAIRRWRAAIDTA